MESARQPEEEPPPGSSLGSQHTARQGRSRHDGMLLFQTGCKSKSAFVKNDTCRSGARPPVAEGNELRSRLLARELDDRVARRQRTDGIGRGGVAGGVECLAAAAAEIDRALLAGPARIGHPALAAERVHPVRVVPQI